MNNIYQENYLNELIIRKKKSILFLIIDILLGTGINVGLLFLSNENNQILMIFLLSIIYIPFIWFSIYLIIEGIIFNHKKYEFMNKILSSDNQQIKGEIIDISKITTINKAIRCYEINVLLENDKRQIFYLDENVKEIPFSKEDIVNLNIKNNYIVGYEVFNNEK